MVGQTMQWGNIRFTIGLIVVIHLEKFLHVYFCDRQEYIRHAELTVYTGSSCPLFYCVRQTILIITNVNPLLFDASYVYLKQVVGN